MDTNRQPTYKDYFKVMIAMKVTSPTEEQPKGFVFYVKLFNENTKQINDTHPLYLRRGHALLLR